MKWLLPVLFCVLVFFAPEQVDARLVPVQCENPQFCGTCEFVSLINNVVQYIISLATLIAVLLFMWAGFMLVTSGGNQSQMEKAKGLFGNVAIGFIILLAAFLIVDTLLAAILPRDSRILNWKEIECVYPTQANYAGGRFNVVDDFDGAGTVVVGGSCDAMTSGPCSVSALESTFGDSASAASQICNIESGGNIAARSGTDLCKTGESFSHGLYQINVFAHYDKLGCASSQSDFMTKNGEGVQGDCADVRTNSKGVSYCAVRDCTVTNEAVYRQCVAAARDQATNLRVAKELFEASGDWDDWRISAGRCGIE